MLINPPVVFTLMRQRWSSTNFSLLLYLPYSCEHQIHIHTWQLLPFSLRQQCIYFYNATCMRSWISKKTLLFWFWRRPTPHGYRYIARTKTLHTNKFKHKFSFFLFLLTERTSLLFLLFSWVRQCKEISLNYINWQAGTTILRQSRLYPPGQGLRIWRLEIPWCLLQKHPM